MSSDDTQSALSRAYELVEAGRYQDARAILDPILAAQPNNADAWWVYAHAVTTAEDGRMALENVVRIDPRYPGAAALLAQARELAPAKPGVTSMPVPPGSIPEEPVADPDFGDEDFDDAVTATPAPRERRATKQPENAKRGGIPLLPVALALAAIIVVALLVLPNLMNPTPAATATPGGEVVSAPTQSAGTSGTEEATEAAAAPTRRPTITPTVEGATAEVVSIDLTAVTSALAAFPLSEGGIAVTQSTLGDTLTVSVCSAPGREMRMLLPQVMNAFAAQSASLGDAVQAIGVTLVNCDTSASLLSVATEIISAQNYANGDLSDAEFAATWHPQ